MLNLLTVLFALSTSVSAFAAADSARGVVETIIDRASKLDNKATKAENTKTIESLVDFDKLTTDALAQNASEVKPAQRAQIRDLLKTIITKTVYPEAPKFFRDVKIQYTGEAEQDGRTHITSLVTKGNKRSTVEYWLAKEAGGYKVVDLAIEGERWVENVSDQFDAVISKQGASGLIAKMRKRASELGTKKK